MDMINKRKNMRNYKNLFFCLAVVFITSGCASVTMLEGNAPKKLSNCEVKVWMSKEKAQEVGKINEICLITGTSSGSFSHTVATAVEKSKTLACDCGATNVYIQAQDAGTLGTASVSLVGFEFTKK